MQDKVFVMLMLAWLALTAVCCFAPEALTVGNYSSYGDTTLEVNDPIEQTVTTKFISTQDGGLQ